MNQTPLRNLLFLSALLFIILSSGSLQCALNCYERTANRLPSPEQVADCHPLRAIEVITATAATFCHHNHADSQATEDPVLSSLTNATVLALSNGRIATPAYRSSDPLNLPPFSIKQGARPLFADLPASQNQKQLLTTVLLM